MKQAAIYTFVNYDCIYELLGVYYQERIIKIKRHILNFLITLITDKISK